MTAAYENQVNGGRHRGPPFSRETLSYIDHHSAILPTACHPRDPGLVPLPIQHLPHQEIIDPLRVIEVRDDVLPAMPLARIGVVLDILVGMA